MNFQQLSKFVLPLNKVRLTSAQLLVSTVVSAMSSLATNADARTVCRTIRSNDGATREVCEQVCHVTRNNDGTSRSDCAERNEFIGSNTTTVGVQANCPVTKKVELEAVSSSGERFDVAILGKVASASTSGSSCFYIPLIVELPDGFQHLPTTLLGRERFSGMDYFTAGEEELTLVTQYRKVDTGETGYLYVYIAPNVQRPFLKFGASDSLNKFIYDTRLEHYALQYLDVQESQEMVTVPVGN
jgi:hypothetical protein